MADDNIDAPEEWRPVPFPGYDQVYEVSSLGRVRRITTSHHNSWKAGRLLKPSNHNKWGHLHVSLYRDNQRKAICVHVLVALAFVGPRPTPKHEVAHDDGNAANNRADNLKWATSTENKADMKRHGTVQSGEKHGASRLTDADVREIRALYAAGGVFHKQLAERFGVHEKTIGKIVRGERWTHLWPLN